MEEVEFCNPFDGKKYDYFMKLEHAGRYLFARDFIVEHKISNVADIACATGYGTEILSKHCKTIYGLDKNNNYIKLAKKRKIQNAEFLTHDLNEKSTINQKFDLIVCFETIEHVENTDTFLKTLNKLLNKDGWLLISIPNEKFEELDENGNIKYKFHKHIFNHKETKQLLEKYGFEIRETLGQSLSNLIVSNQHQIKYNRTELYNKKLLNRYNFNKKSIELNSYIFAYPNKLLLDETYSYLYVCKKNS